MSKFLSRNQLISILAHLSAWGMFFSIPVFLKNQEFSRHGISEVPPVMAMFLFAVLIIQVFYLNFWVLIPRVLNRLGVRYYVLSVAVFGLVAMGLASSIKAFFIEKADEISSFPFIFPFLLAVAMSLSIRLLMDKTQSERQQKERENETLKSELSFLRSQISPHFLFNMMNNVVALSRVKPEKVEPTLIQLSQLMRYMLYSSDEKKVSIAQEIDYLENYIALQKLRFGDSVDVIFTKNAADTEGSFIEPMLLIPFVENAFKHGTGMIAQPRIDINLFFRDNTLIFNILNKFDPLSIDTKDNDSGIGLKNVSRRLALLYGDNQILNIANKDGVFEVNLAIRFNT